MRWFRPVAAMMAVAFVAVTIFGSAPASSRMLHHLQIVGRAGEQERRRAHRVQVSARELRLRLRHARIHICAVGQQRLHQPQLGLTIRNAGHRVFKPVHADSR